MVPEVVRRRGGIAQRLSGSVADFRAGFKRKSTGKAAREAGFSMTDLGKVLILLGLMLAVAGVVLMMFGRMNLPLGRLPGDIVYRGKNTTVYFPIVTSVVVSVVLSIVLYLVGRWRK
jgi:hypothetical protein